MPCYWIPKGDVCVPVTVTPYAKTGDTQTICCGEPLIETDDTPCVGIKNGSCTFKIKQTICVAVPVNFGASSTVGEPYVDCLDIASTDICTDCK